MSNLDFFVNLTVTEPAALQSTSYIKTYAVYVHMKQDTPPEEPPEEEDPGDDDPSDPGEDEGGEDTGGGENTGGGEETPGEENPGTSPKSIKKLNKVLKNKPKYRNVLRAAPTDAIQLVTSAAQVDDLVADATEAAQIKLAFNFLNKIYIVLKENIPAGSENLVFTSMNDLAFHMGDYVGEDITSYGYKGQIYKHISTDDARLPSFSKLENTCYCVDIGLEVVLPAKWCSYPGYSNMTFESMPGVQWVSKSMGDIEIFRDNGITFMWLDGGGNQVLGYWFATKKLGSEAPKIEYARVSVQNTIFNYISINQPNYDMEAFQGIKEAIRNTLNNMIAQEVLRAYDDIILPPPSQQTDEDVVKGFVRQATTGFDSSKAVWYFEMRVRGR